MYLWDLTMQLLASYYSPNGPKFCSYPPPSSIRLISLAAKVCRVGALAKLWFPKKEKKEKKKRGGNQIRKANMTMNKFDVYSKSI